MADDNLQEDMLAEWRSPKTAPSASPLMLEVCDGAASWSLSYATLHAVKSSKGSLTLFFNGYRVTIRGRLLSELYSAVTKQERESIVVSPNNQEIANGELYVSDILVEPLDGTANAENTDAA